MPGEEKSGPWHGEEVGRNVSGGGGGQQAVDHVWPADPWSAPCSLLCTGRF